MSIFHQQEPLGYSKQLSRKAVASAAVQFKRPAQRSPKAHRPARHQLGPRGDPCLCAARGEATCRGGKPSASTRLALKQRHIRSPLLCSVARGAIPAAADEASLINISKRGHPIRRGLRVLDSWVDADRDPGLRRLTNTCMRANAQRLCACASVGQGQSRRPEKTRRMGSFLCFMF